MRTKSKRSSPASCALPTSGCAAIALRSRLSRATTLTSSISAPARSIVAGTTHRFSTSGHAVVTSASGVPSTTASYVDGTPRRCSTPRAVEAFPCGSRSTTSTRCPSWARAAAMFTVDVVLPTPPFWLATTITRVAVGTRQRRAASGRRAGRSTVCSAARASGVRVVAELRSGVAATSPAVRTPKQAPDVSRETTGSRSMPACSGTVHLRSSPWPVDNSGSSCGALRSAGHPRPVENSGPVVGGAASRDARAPSVTGCADTAAQPLTSGSAQTTRTTVVGGSSQVG